MCALVLIVFVLVFVAWVLEGVRCVFVFTVWVPGVFRQEDTKWGCMELFVVYVLVFGWVLVFVACVFV